MPLETYLRELRVKTVRQLFIRALEARTPTAGEGPLRGQGLGKAGLRDGERRTRGARGHGEGPARAAAARAPPGARRVVETLALPARASTDLQVKAKVESLPSSERCLCPSHIPSLNTVKHDFTPNPPRVKKEESGPRRNKSKNQDRSRGKRAVLEHGPGKELDQGQQLRCKVVQKSH